MSSELRKHVNDLSRRDLDKFAKDYFDVKLDGRQGLPKMQKSFWQKIKNKENIKPFPWEEVIEEPSTDEEPDITIDVEVVEPAPVHEVEVDVVIADDTPVTVVDEQELPQEPEAPQEPAVNEPKEKAALDLADFVDVVPSFNLSFRQGSNNFAVVSYRVTDFMDELRDGKVSIADVPTGLRRSVVSVLHYVAKHGSVTLRETRNSQFVTYKKEEF